MSRPKPWGKSSKCWNSKDLSPEPATHVTAGQYAPALRSVENRVTAHRPYEWGLDRIGRSFGPGATRWIDHHHHPSRSHCGLTRNHVHAAGFVQKHHVNVGPGRETAKAAAADCSCTMSPNECHSAEGQSASEFDKLWPGAEKWHLLADKRLTQAIHSPRYPLSAFHILPEATRKQSHSTSRRVSFLASSAAP